MKLAPGPESGLLVLDGQEYADERGRFREVWRRSAQESRSLDVDFVQDNMSESHTGVLRGVHFQYERPQGKLVTVLQGAIFDVAVDLRHGSPTFGQWFGVELSAASCRQFYIPPGFGHGFQALERSLVLYKCTDYFVPHLDAAVRWDDARIGIDWPDAAAARLSEKDAVAPLLKDLEVARLTRWQPR